MLTEGTIEPKNWHPAPEDNATAEQYTELDAELKIQAGQISLKASQKDVDTIKKTVSDNKTSIDVNTKSIALKANQTTVDQINGTVKQLDAELKIQAGQISSKVSRNDVTGMLSGYATQTWTQSQIKQTADSINLSVSKVQNDAEVKFSQLQVTVNGIQGTVQNKADKSQVTQLANQITSVVGSVANPNLIPNSGRPRDTSYWTASTLGKFKVESGHSYYEHGKTTLFSLGNTSATQETTVKSATFPVKSGKKYTISGLFFASGGVTGTDIWFISNDYTKTTIVASNVKYSPAQSEYKSYTFTVPDGVDNGFVRIDNNGSSVAPNNSAVYFAELKMEYGEHATPWVYDNSQSQITQLEDNINLRVQKNDVVNQINVSSEGVLIAGNKIHITGLTSIDSAVIKSAMIADISADKITAGTINAANVNLINMNASNITTGTIKGASLSINLLNGNVTFQKGRIYSTTGTIDMNIDQGYLSVTNASGTNKNNVLIKDGEIAFTQPGLFDPSKDPYLRITNSVVESSFGSSTIQARGALEMNIKGHESSVTHLGQESFAGIKFGMGNANEFEGTYIGGSNVGVTISGGTSTNSMMSMSPHIIIGSKGGSDTGGNRITVEAEYFHVNPTYAQTTSDGANVYVAPDGALVRSTSASKYKQNIVRHVDLNDSEKLLNIPLARWDDKAEVRRTGTSKRYFGMIAEDLAAAGLEYLVDRGPNGEIEGIEYSKVALLLIPEVKKLRNKIEMLEQQNGGNIA